LSAGLSRLFRVGYPAALAAFIAVLVAGALFPGPAEAHGLVGRGDLPLPDWLLAWGAALLLIGSFAGLVVLWQRPLLEGDHWRPSSAILTGAILNPVTQTVLGILSVALLVLTIYTGLVGTEAPDRNFSVTFVFVTFWLGLVVLSVLFGNVFRALSPWRAIGNGVSKLFTLVAGQSAPAPLTYPDRLGRWPAVAGLVGFLWFELAWNPGTSVPPGDVAVATIIYSAITFVGMALFGVDRWNERGETFSVYFGMFASLSVFEVRDGRIGRRRIFEGAGRWTGGISGSLALVLVAIGGTTFDGAQEGAIKSTISSTFETFSDAGLSALEALRITNTLYLAATLLVVFGIFWAGIQGMRVVSHRYSARVLGNRFAHAFIPIALAYLVAHYFSLVVFQEQAQFTYLLSDPLGDGSNVFGTAGSAIDYGAVGATAVQWVQFGSIVAGHALALALGHDRALKLFGNTRDASWSQAVMLVVMLVFSLMGLYLLSQANG